MKIQKRIVEKLQSKLSLAYLDVVNESHQHNVPENSETHFKVTCVAESFSNMNKVKRHQAVYGLLAEELAGPVHALALHLYSPEEWSKIDTSPESPQCLGGSKP